MNGIPYISIVSGRIVRNDYVNIFDYTYTYDLLEGNGAQS